MLLTLRNGRSPLNIFDDVFNEALNWKSEYSDFVLQDNQYSLEIPLAGFKKENIDIITNEEYITINASRKEGRIKYQKSFYLPRKVDLSEVKAKYEDGLLTITFQKENKKIENKVKID